MRCSSGKRSYSSRLSVLKLMPPPQGRNRILVRRKPIPGKTLGVYDGFPVLRCEDAVFV